MNPLAGLWCLKNPLLGREESQVTVLDKERLSWLQEWVWGGRQGRSPQAGCLPGLLPAGWGGGGGQRVLTFQMLASLPYTTAMLPALPPLMSCLSVSFSSSDTKPMKELSGV